MSLPPTSTTPSPLDLFQLQSLFAKFRVQRSVKIREFNVRRSWSDFQLVDSQLNFLFVLSLGSLQVLRISLKPDPTPRKVTYLWESPGAERLVVSQTWYKYVSFHVCRNLLEMICPLF